jgi:hypothetical protein
MQVLRNGTLVRLMQIEPPEADLKEKITSERVEKQIRKCRFGEHGKKILIRSI